MPQNAMFWKLGNSGRGVRRVRRPDGSPLYELIVQPDGQPAKRREYHVVSRMGDNHSLGVYNNNVSAVERALVERYFLCEVENGVFLPALGSTRAAWRQPALREFQRKVVEDVTPEVTVLTLGEVVNCYTGAKRRIYENAHRSLMRNPVNRKDACLRPFTKFEKQNLSKAPRIINPRSPRYNLVLGKYLKKAEKKYFHALNKVWGEHTAHTVIKGMNAFEAAEVMRAKWLRFKNPVAVGLDAKKFDMHVSVEGLRYEHEFYNLVFNDPQLAALLSWQLKSTGVAYCADGKVKFRIPGTRCSGDLNTSLGNCLLMCSLIWAMCHELGIEAELANNGDDCVLFIEEEDLTSVLERVPGYFETHGFRMTVEPPVHVFEELEFCQSRPVLLEAGWCMVRNVRTCLQKDPMCLIPIQNERVWRKWLGAVGECGMATVPGCPVLESFYRAFARSGVSSRKGFREHIFKNTSMLERGSNRTGVVTAEARASFYRAFGITPDYQIALEQYYDRMEIGPWDGEVRAGHVENAPPAFLRHL